VPGPALTSAPLYSCSPRLRMESPILPFGRGFSPTLLVGLDEAGLPSLSRGQDVGRDAVRDH
jgi:hypothetical protein